MDLTPTNQQAAAEASGVVTSQAPTSAVSPGQVAQPYNELSDALDKSADALMKGIAVPAAKRQAANDLINQKITRNADGSVTVENPASAPLLFGAAADAYKDAVTVGTIAQHGNELSQKFAELHAKFPTDPQGFKTASDGYLTQRAGQLTGPMGEAVQREGAQLQTQHLNSITSATASNDIENQKKSVLSQADDLKNTMDALARQGGTDTPEFKQAAAKYTALMNALASNPLFKMPQEMIDLDIKHTVALMKGEALNSSIDATFNKKNGKAEAQKLLTDQVLNNPDLEIKDKNRLYTQGMARLQYLTADAKEGIDANRKNTELLETNLANGKVKPEDPVVGMAIQHALDIGDSESAKRIGAAYLTAPHMRAIDPLPDSIKSQVLGIAYSNYKQRAAQIETGSNPDQVSPTGAAGKYQFVPSTWAKYGAGRDIHGDQEAAMDQFTADNQQSMTHSLGRAPSPGELYLAHQQGASGAAKLLANPNARAGDLVGDKAIAVNGGDPNAPASAFTSMWVNKFERGAPINVNHVVAPSANGGPGFTVADAQKNPFLISAYVRTIAADPEGRINAAKQTASAINTALDKGILPSVDSVALVDQAARLHPESMGNASDDIHGRLQGSAAMELPEEQRNTYFKSLKEASQGQDVHQTNIAAAAWKQKTEQDKNFQEHPYDESARRRWTEPAMPIDPTQPNTVAPALVDRAAKSARIGTLNHTPPPPLLDKDAMPKLQTALQGQNAPAILGSISQSLQPDEMQTLLKEEGFRSSVTGMSRSGDPAKMNAAYSFMDTQQKQNPLEFEKQFPDGLKDLRAWQSNLSFYPPDEAAKRLLRSYDPAQSAAHAASDTVAHKQLESVSADNVVSKFSTGIGPIGIGARAPVGEDAGVAKGALKADYDKNYKDGFAATGDATMADKFAMEKLNLKYAVSPTNGNKVMANAPERSYPMVGGSYDWMANQLDEAVAKSVGVTKASGAYDKNTPAGELYGTVAPGETFGNETPGERRYGAKRALVSDQTTDRDIASGKPPSYQVIVQDTNGRWSALTGATVEGSNTPQRFRFDPTTPFAERAASMNKLREMAAGVTSEQQP